MRLVYSNAAAPEHVHDVHYVYLGKRLVVGTKRRLLVNLGADMLRRWDGLDSVGNRLGAVENKVGIRFVARQMEE